MTLGISNWETCEPGKVRRDEFVVWVAPPAGRTDPREKDSRSPAWGPQRPSNRIKIPGEESKLLLPCMTRPHAEFFMDIIEPSRSCDREIRRGARSRRFNDACNRQWKST